ncbi:Bcr/CflA family multidrug efflux MFS transporter [Pasteurellaceae bacterium 22721_9_1]
MILKNRALFILTLAMLSMLPPLGIDMYLPSFLQMAKDLEVSPEQVQYTLTFFTFGMAAGQLFWGPVGDSFGRKPIMLLGVSISAGVSFVLTSINSIENFTALRFAQGFFSSAPVVLVGALLRDLFNKNELSKMMSTITLVFMVAPLLAPIVGGYIIKFWHWHSIFHVIMAIGILATLLVALIIPETHKKENRIPLRLNIIAKNFVSLWKQKEVLGYMFSSGLGFGGMFAFITSGSIVYIGLYGIAPENFGYFFMLNISVLALGSFLNGRLVFKMGAERMLQIGLAIQLAAGLWLILVALFDLGFWPMALGIALFVGQNSLISSNAMASILEKFPNMAGTANSLAGTVRFGIGASVGSLVALMKMDSAAPMLYTMGGCVILAVCCYYFLTFKQIKEA